MATEYNDINDTEKLHVADILSKREAVEGALTVIQNKRATLELAWKAKEQSLRAESNKLTEELRNLRTATLT